jgi:hypothetical protein
LKHHIEVRSDHWIGVRSLLVSGLRALDDWIGVRSLLVSGLRALDKRIFAEPEAFAWVLDWEVDRGSLFRRAYRSREFDALQECGLCHGTGAAATGGGTARRKAGVTAGVQVSGGRETDRLGEGPPAGMREACSLCDGIGRIRRFAVGTCDEW